MTSAESPAGSRAVLEVIAPGLLTTVQDGGRPDHRDEGVPVSGACDPVGLAVANLVVGNPPGAAVLESTILGPELLALEDTVIGLGGADLGARIEPGGRRLVPGRAHRLSAGDRLTFAAGPPGEGCRAYIAVPGGVDVPEILGSRSTSLVGGFGGHEGRPLREGDRILAPQAGRRMSSRIVRWPGPATPRTLDAPIRVLPGPSRGEAHSDTRPGAADGIDVEAAALVGTAWEVAWASDRRGLRLEGATIPFAREAAAQSHGVLPGTIQLTPSGQPLVLLNDCGTTGGYPVIGVVISADLWRLGQARPGTSLRFVRTDAAAASAAAAELRAWLAAAGQRLATEVGDAWDDLADDAGA